MALMITFVVVFTKGTVADLKQVARESLGVLATKSAAEINERFASIATLSLVLRDNVEYSLEHDRNPTSAELASYGPSPLHPSVYCTTYNYGGAAIYIPGYSGSVTDNATIEKYVWRTAYADQILQQLCQNDPMIVQTWIITHTDVTRLYPFIPLHEIMGPDVYVTTSIVYTIVDNKNNPSRTVQWTPPYVDYVGSGWTVSCISPADVSSVMEASCGIDITTGIIVDKVLNLEILWGGYAVLLDGQGVVLALPEKGRNQWRLHGNNSYSQIILTDTFQNDDWNVNKRNDTQAIAQALTLPDGVKVVDFNGVTTVMAWSEITETSWHLLIFVSQDDLYAEAYSRRRFLIWLSCLFAVLMSTVLAALMVWVYRQNRKMSQEVSGPLLDIDEMISTINHGQYVLDPPSFHVREFTRTALFLSSMASQLNKMVSNLEALNNSYSRFLPQKCLDQLGKPSVLQVNKGDAIEMNMTIMFADIRNFTNIAEKLSPELTFKLVNKYANEVNPIIVNHKGFVDKYLGDAVMALFPVPSSHAVLCAIEMQEQLAILRHSSEMPALSMLNIGIGVHTGKVILGTIGDDHRMDVTVISDAVNTASRLENLTKLFQAHILTSYDSIKELDDTGFTHHRYIGQMRVKGKDIPMLIHEVLDNADPLFEIKHATRDELKSAISDYEVGEFSSCLNKLNSLLCINKNINPNTNYNSYNDEHIPGSTASTPCPTPKTSKSSQLSDPFVIHTQPASPTQDPVCLVYHRTCAKYLEQGPPKSWDHVSPLTLDFTDKF
ncbi:response regulator [Pelomyxa schiedti]|nr:response regulator [Pelomyxa schiedti]